MKNKLNGFLHMLEGKRLGAMLLRGFRAVWKLISNNFGLKVLSLLIAVLLWNFVISTDTSITRTKTISGLNGYISGQSILNSTYGLALLDDPTEALGDIAVLVEVSQSEFSKVSQDNVQVTLDLSGVRRSGVQQVPLKASTSYGRVVNIMPDSVTLTFENIDSRIIPVNVKTTGTPVENQWYNISRKNPSSLTIKGAASVVQSIASAYVYVDVTGEAETFTAAERYVLLDGDGLEISQAMLDRSATSISVGVDVYPAKEIPISAEQENVITGEPEEGYVVTSVSIQPEVLTVAAEQDLLDSIEELHIDPISVEGLSQSFTARAEVSKLSAFKSISAEEVYVNVTIEEETSSAWVEDVKISFINKGEGLRLSASDAGIRVYVTGPRSVVESLCETGFVATIDLEGLQMGVYSMGMSFPEDTYPDITFTPETSEIRFALISED